MSLSKPTGGGFTPKQNPILPQGVHVGKCYSIVELGTHMESFQGQPPVAKQKVHFSWEVTTHMHVFDPAKGPQPLALFKEYAYLFGGKKQSNIEKDLKSWRGLDKLPDGVLNLREWLGQICSINVLWTAAKEASIPAAESLYKDGKIIYANIGSITRVLPNTPMPASHNELMYFDFDGWDVNPQLQWQLYFKLPKWIQDKIATSQEWSGIITKYPMPARPEATTAQQPASTPNTFAASAALPSPGLPPQPGNMPSF